MSEALSKIGRDMKLVVPLELDDGTPAFVHSVSISLEAFGVNFRILGRAWSMMMRDEVTPDAGGRFASAYLMDAAHALYGEEDGTRRANAILTEIMRGSTFVSQGAGGVQSGPYYNAKQNGGISAEDARQVESILVFFILVLLSQEPKRAAIYLNGLRFFVDARIVSLTSTEFVNSLRTSSAAAPSGEKTAAS